MTTGVKVGLAPALLLSLGFPPPTTAGTVFGDMDMLVLGTKACGEELLVGGMLLVAVGTGTTLEGEELLLLLLPIGITVGAGDCDGGCLKCASVATGLDDDDDDDDEVTTTAGW